MEMLMENADEHLVSLGGVSSAGSGKDSKHFTKAIEVKKAYLDESMGSHGTL
jgi:hypothetical protein